MCYSKDSSTPRDHPLRVEHARSLYPLSLLFVNRFIQEGHVRTPGGIVLLMVVLGFAGCSGSSPSAPAPGSQPPPGAFFIRGTVSDTAFRPLAGARVEVVDGRQAGLATTADAKGVFSLIGTFDDATRFRATKEGHATAIRDA